MQNWFFKYKIYHIPFWIAYHILWLIINIGSLDGVVTYLFKGELPVKFIGYIIFQAAGAYFNLYYLIPKFLYTGRYKTYVTLLLLTIWVCSGLIVSGYYLNAWTSELTFFQLFNRQPSQYIILFLTAAFPSTLGSMTLAMSVKLAKNWLQAEKRRLVLEKDNLETELKYLKSQINPHFLFNTINSIFVLIHKNPDLASESLASFSEMLRYQLYECNDKEIPLRQDMQFLDNFIELETLRLNENQTQLAFEMDQNIPSGIRIAPFILLPFVENAFKHVSKGKTQKNFINMMLTVDPSQTLHLAIENSHNSDSNNHTPGIGLKNVRRRLELVYPGKYELTIVPAAKTFSIDLKLDLACN